jgi:hypothetical protein
MLLSLPCGRDKILGILMWLLRRAKQTVDVVLHDERLEGETEADWLFLRCEQGFLFLGLFGA